MTTVHVMNKSNRSPLPKRAVVSMKTVMVLFGKIGVNVFYPKAGIYGPKPWIRTKVATKRLSGPLILKKGSPCGVGLRSRLRKCGSYTTFEDVENMCYNPWVKRTGNGVPDMKNHPDYYQSEKCYVQCPMWGPWTPCTAPPGGFGIKIRFDQSDPSIQDVMQCSTDFRPKEPETHYGPCNTACGIGKRQKGICFNDSYFMPPIPGVFPGW